MAHVTFKIKLGNLLPSNLVSKGRLKIRRLKTSGNCKNKLTYGNFPCCAQLRNVRTGATITARIVDRCSNAGLDLDYSTVFQRLDTDGVGWQQGSMDVGYSFVDCGDGLSEHPLSSIIDDKSP